MENALYLAIGAAATALFGVVRDTFGFRRNVADKLMQIRIEAYRAFANQAHLVEQVATGGEGDPAEAERELARLRYDLTIVASPATLEAALEVNDRARELLPHGDHEALERFRLARTRFIDRAQHEVTRGH